MVIYAEKTRHWWEHGGAGGLRRGDRRWRPSPRFRPSGRIAQVLGRTGINVMTRLMGLILAAMAVELLADGLVKLFPVLASHAGALSRSHAMRPDEPVLRLHHRRRRHRRLPAGQPAQRRPGAAACCWSRPAAATTTTGSTSRWATCTASATRAPTGCTSPSPTPGLNGRKLRYPRGKVLGGCSSINGMIYMRGQARDYDHWAAADRRRRLALGRTACPTSSATKTTGAAPHARRLRPTAPAANGASRSSACAGTILDAFARRGAAGRHPGHRRLQPRRQRRRGLLRGQPARAACAGTRPRPSCARRRRGPTCRCGPARRSRACCSSAAPTARCAAPASRCGRPPAARRAALRARARGGAGRRRGRHAADPAAVGHRRRRAAAAARHRGRSTSCPASARTCRTTCRSAPCSRCEGVKTLNTHGQLAVGQGR